MRKSQSLVSIIIPTFNHGAYLKETIQSVLSQTYQNFEIIITDDFSTDKTIDIISGFKDQRIKLFKFNKNNGISAALNNGIIQSKGEYLAILGSDDIFCKTKLAKQIDFLENNPSTGAVFTLANLINENGKPYRDVGAQYTSFSKQRNMTRYEWLNYFFMQNNVLCASSVVIQKKIQEEVGLYDERLLQLQDLDMWIRLCMKNDIYLMQEKLTKYRVRQNNRNISSYTIENQIRLKFELKIILKNYFKITSAEEFNSIFSSTITSKNISPEIIKYNLASLALTVKSNIHQLFGLELLYDLMENKESKKILENEFNFTNKNLYEIAGRTDVFDLANFHKITTSKFYKLWQLLKQQENKEKHAIVGILKRIKYGIFILWGFLFDTFINVSFKLKMAPLTSLMYSIKRRFQLLFYDDSIDNNIHYIQSPTLKSLRQFIDENNIDHDVVYPSKNIKSYPPHYYKEEKKVPVLIKHPEIFVAKIKKANIVGSSSIILSGDHALLEEVPSFSFNRLDLQSNVIRKHNGNRILIDSIKSGTSIEKGIMLCGTASYNYYHWLVEFLPKYHLIERLNIAQYPLLVDEVVLNTPQLYQSLEAINTLNLQIIPIKQNHNYFVQELVYPSLMSWTAINIRPQLTVKYTDSFTSAIAIRYLRRKLVQRKKIGSRRIYLSRSGTTNRKFNEDEVINTCKKFNYEIVYPQQLSFAEQIHLFSQAHIIVSASGAGLTNMIFAPSGTKILCLKNSKDDLTVFSNLAEILKHNLIFLHGTVDKSDSTQYHYQKRFNIDTSKLEDALKRIEID